MKKPVLTLLPLIALIGSVRGQNPTTPIVFVTQVPPTATVETVTSVGNNHLPTVKAAPRGGDLMIRYPNGTAGGIVRALTRDAGFGSTSPTGDQGLGSIAVRDPHIHWSGQRILFSMVVTTANPSADRWQMYEARGFEQGGTLSITKVPNQPAEFNNVQACYAPDDRIIYVSDRTLDGTTATYPAIDEKGQGRINTGLWSLNPQSGDLLHVEHSPSGSFDPFVDSYGRVLFTRWDHLQRDQKSATNPATVFDYSSELSSATFNPGTFTESFPEAIANSGVEKGHQFDLFMPWTVNPDGTELLTLNHVGRHEFSPTALRSRADVNLSDMNISSPAQPGAGTALRAGSLMQLTEHPTSKGRLFGTDAVMTALSAGRIVTIPASSPTTNPSDMRIFLTSGNGILRDPAVLTGDRLLVSVATGPNTGGTSYGGGTPSGGVVGGPLDPNSTLPVTNPFTIKVSDSMVTNSGLVNFSTALTAPQQTVHVVNYDNGQTMDFNGPLWQLQPVEVRQTSRPTVAVTKMEVPEQDIFISTGVSPLALKAWMRSRNLALMTVRNVTQRDGGDHQQPTNLAVQNGVSSVKPLAPGQTVPPPDYGPTYTVKSLQVVQGEYLRGYSNGGTALPGRRIKATAPHYSEAAVPPAPAGTPEGSTAVSPDGSAAALVPAARATSWQLLDHANSPVVRERYWLSFQAGEIRACTSCHGVNRKDQADKSAATNAPEALRTLLQTVKQSAPEISAANGFQVWSENTLGMPLTATEDDDGDGISNMLEWSMGYSPVNAADKPPVMLEVKLLNMVDDKFAKISFPRSTSEKRSVMVLETSTDMIDWRSVINISSAVSMVNPAYSVGKEPAGTDREMVVLSSGLPLSRTQDRYYRLRVTMN